MGEHGEGASVQAGQPVSLPQVTNIMWKVGDIISGLKGALSDGARELVNHPVSGFQRVWTGLKTRPI